MKRLIMTIAAMAVSINAARAQAEKTVLQLYSRANATVQTAVANNYCIGTDGPVDGAGLSGADLATFIIIQESIMSLLKMADSATISQILAVFCGAK